MDTPNEAPALELAPAPAPIVAAQDGPRVRRARCSACGTRCEYVRRAGADERYLMAADGAVAATIVEGYVMCEGCEANGPPRDDAAEDEEDER